MYSVNISLMDPQIFFFIKILNVLLNTRLAVFKILPGASTKHHNFLKYDFLQKSKKKNIIKKMFHQAMLII